MRKATFIVTLFFLITSCDSKAQFINKTQLYILDLNLIGGSSCFLSVFNDDGELFLYSKNQNKIFQITPEGKLKSTLDFSTYGKLIKEIDFSYEGKLLLKLQNDELIYSYDLLSGALEKHKYIKPEDWYILKHPFYEEIFKGVSWIPFDYLSEDKRKQLGTKFNYGVNLYMTSDTVVYSFRYRQIMKIYDGNFFSMNIENMWLSQNVSNSSKILHVNENEILYMEGRNIYSENLSTGIINKLDIKISNSCNQNILFNQGVLKIIEVKEGYLVVSALF